MSGEPDRIAADVGMLEFFLRAHPEADWPAAIDAFLQPLLERERQELDQQYQEKFGAMVNRAEMCAHEWMTKAEVAEAALLTLQRQISELERTWRTLVRRFQVGDRFVAIEQCADQLAALLPSLAEKEPSND